MEPTPMTVQSILLTKIMANPRQPRRRFAPGSIPEMAESLKTLGQQTPAKVRPLTLEERTHHPGFEFLMIGGHRRLAGAQLAGWTALDCIVLDILPAETHLAALMDNDSEEMDWWDWDLAIEEQDKANPDLTQRALAGRLGVSLTKVNTALKITKTLSPNARALVTQNLDQAAAPKGDFVPNWNKLKAPYQINEFVLLALADLADTLAVYRALKVALELHLTEQKAQKLVEWVKSGHNPEDYGQKADTAAQDPNDPYSAYWANLPQQVKVSRGKKGYRVVMDLSPAEAVPVVYGAMSNWEHLKVLSGENHDLRYRNALHQVHQDAVPLRKKEVAEKAQAEAGRKAALEAKAAEKARKLAKRQAALQAKMEAKAQKQKPEIPASQPAPTLREPQGPEQSRRVGAAPRDDEKGEKSFLGKIGDLVEQKTGLTPQDLKAKAEGMLAKDAVQAANYQIRRGMRNILKDLF